MKNTAANDFLIITHLKEMLREQGKLVPENISENCFEGREFHHNLYIHNDDWRSTDKIVLVSDVIKDGEGTLLKLELELKKRNLIDGLFRREKFSWLIKPNMILTEQTKKDLEEILNNSFVKSLKKIKVQLYLQLLEE